MPLRLRLLIALAPLFLAGLVAVDVATYEALQSSLISQVDQQLQAAHPGVESALLGNDRNPPRPGGGPARGGPPLAVPPGTWGAVLSADGNVSSRTTFVSEGTTSSAQPVLPAGLASLPPRSFETVDGSGGVSRYRLYVDTLQNQPAGRLLVAIPLDSADSTLSGLLVLELVTTIGVGVVVVAATWWIVRRGMRPLERMGTTAQSIVASNLGERVSPADERTEVGRLGAAINTMLSRLEEAFAERERTEQQLRHFISDASHELRTPLTSMRGYAELLRRRDVTEADLELGLRRIEEETSRMAVLVDDLLLLARLDQGRPLEKTAVDLGELIRDAAADARAADPQRHVVADVGPAPAVLGDPLRLRQAVGNLWRNALVHTPAASPVEITLRGDDGRALIRVIDHGRGIPPEQRERIFERFHRADPKRSADQGGSGLGLSIAAAVVAAHDGQIRVEETPGGGATFVVELPADSKQNPGAV